MRLKLGSLSSLRRMGTHRRKSIFERHVCRGGHRVSFLCLGRVLNVGRNSILSISLSIDRSALLLVPRMRMRRICLQSMRMLPSCGQVRV